MSGITYFLKVDGIQGDAQGKGVEGYFAIDEFTFTELTRLASGGGGGGAGRAQFDPLMVDIATLSPGLVALLKALAAGTHIKTVELVGMRSVGDGGLQKVYDLTLSDVTVAGLAADGGHDTAIAFDYRKVTETIRLRTPTARSIRAGLSVSTSPRAAARSRLSITMR
jgi:type VI protein secretion system component Hcp